MPANKLVELLLVKAAQDEYAVEFRYDAAPDEGDDFLDRADIRRKIQTFRDWVVDHVRG